MNWHTAELPELELMQKCAVSNMLLANNYSAVNCLLYQKKYRFQIAVQDGWFFGRYEEGSSFSFSFPHHVDGDMSGIGDAIAILELEAKESASGLGFRNVTLEEKEILSSRFPSLMAEKDEGLGDYIYLTENLASLPGKKYSKKRNHVNQFRKKRPDFVFQELTADNLDCAMRVEEAWLAESRAAGLDNADASALEMERAIILAAIKDFGYFSEIAGMAGGLLFVQDEPVAFCIASLLSPSVTDVHFEKCLSAFAQDGGYAVINNEFSKTVSTEYINREEDLGIPGLRKAKLSYYPEMVLEKFNVRI